MSRIWFDPVVPGVSILCCVCVRDRLFLIYVWIRQRSKCVPCKVQDEQDGSTTTKSKRKKGKRLGKGKKSKQPTNQNDSTELAVPCTDLVMSNGPYIAKDTLRVGSLDPTSGTYGRWHHLPCWRVPMSVWSGLTQPTKADWVLHDLKAMDEVVLTGLYDLSEEDCQIVCEHVMNQNHWARPSKKKETEIVSKKRKALSDVTVLAEPNSKEPDDNEEVPPNKIVKTKQRFTIPRPGVDGAIDANALDGKRFVLTGLFPEVGGGTGLNMGKDKVKAMIESFGGRVTSAVSGKTDYVVVGQEPGATKVGAAQDRGIPLVDVRSVQQMLLNEMPLEQLEQAPPPQIKSYSAGYQDKRIDYY